MIKHKAIDGLRQELQKLEAELKPAEREVQIQQAALPAAIEEDALAEAIKRRHGKRVKLKVPEVEDRLAKASKRVKELKADIQVAGEELEQAFATNKATIESDFDQALSVTRAEYREVLEALRTKHSELIRREADLEEIQEGRSRLNREPRVPGKEKADEDDMPKLPNGNDVKVSTLFAALEVRGEPPKPKVIEAPAQPLSRHAIGGGVFAP